MNLIMILLTITGLMAISPFLFLLPLPFLMKGGSKNLKTAKEPPLDKKFKEKLKQKKVAKSIKLGKIKIKKGKANVSLIANENLDVDYLIISFLNKNKEVLQSIKKEKFNIEKNKPFTIQVPIKLKQAFTKYIQIELSTGGGVKTKIIKKLKFLNLV